MVKRIVLQNRDIISYLFFGACTTFVSWGSYYVFVAICSTGIVTGNCLSWICATLFAFVTNKLWVFQSRNWNRKLVIREITLFYSSRIITGIIEMVGVPLTVKMGLDAVVFGVKGFAAKIIISVIVVVSNYVLSKLLVFKNGKLD